MSFSFFFFFNNTATTEIYTLSLHDALPISSAIPAGARRLLDIHRVVRIIPLVKSLCPNTKSAEGPLADLVLGRSEEHTSELQSLTNLVCRLLLEKKNKKIKKKNNITKKVKY